MPRKPRVSKKIRAPLTPVEIAYLTDDDSGIEASIDQFILSCYRRGSTGLDTMPEPEEVWKKNRTKYLRAFIRANPGKRPTPWWQWDAQKERVVGWDYTHFDTPQRLRLGGTGTPTHEILAAWSGFSKGISTSWENIDPADPPIFESETAYLSRHGLLTTAEKKWLTSHPGAMQPEGINEEEKVNERG